nr:VCBS domain-containing protein [Microvirga zambiensis]
MTSADHINQTLTVQSVDGTASETITVAVSGADDAAQIRGTKSGVVTEDTNPSASGTLTVSDKDSGQSSFQPQTTHNDLGTFHLDTDGSWNFVLDNSAAVQGLTANDHLLREFTVQSADGTTETVSVTINGSNDLASISGTSTGSVTEDANPQPQVVTGKLNVTDVDTGEAYLLAQELDTDYGHFHLAADGAWSFTLNNAAAQPLTASDHILQTMTAHSADGTATAVNVTVNGVDEVQAANLIVNFEDRPDYDSPIPDGYNGFNWHAANYNLYETDGKQNYPSSGYAKLDPDGNVAFTPFAADPVEITRTNGSDFVFDKVDMMAAWATSMIVKVTGYNNGVVVGSQSVVIDNKNATTFDPSWGSIDQLEFDVTQVSGTYNGNGSGNHLALDNFYFIV